jgi:7,8-dihydroneopterin aldolase/epimerase/oxygenase
MDEIRIRDLKVNFLIGVYPFEMENVQPLHLDLSLFLETKKTFATDSLGDTIDYHRVTNEICFLLSNGQYRLLETAAGTMVNYLFMRNRLVDNVVLEQVRLKLAKPAAMAGKAVPELVIKRSRHEIHSPRPASKGVSALEVFSSKTCSVFLLNVTGDEGLWHLEVDQQNLACLSLTPGLELKEIAGTHSVFVRDHARGGGAILCVCKDLFQKENVRVLPFPDEGRFEGFSFEAN